MNRSGMNSTLRMLVSRCGRTRRAIRSDYVADLEAGDSVRPGADNALSARRDPRHGADSVVEAVLAGGYAARTGGAVSDASEPAGDLGLRYIRNHLAGSGLDRRHCRVTVRQLKV